MEFGFIKMKYLDEYDNVDDAVADWIDYVATEDYEGRWPIMSDQFRGLDQYRVAEVILGYYGFSEESDSTRMRTYLYKDDAPFYSVAPIVPRPFPIINRESGLLVTLEELKEYLPDEAVSALFKYSKYFKIDWDINKE